jgi:hypothetical protein
VGIWLFLVLLLLAQTSGCSSNKSPFAEMIERGFYAYVLPDEFIVPQGWQVTEVEKDNWEAHCLGGPSAPWNPITVIYLDETGTEQLRIRVSDRDVIWNRSRSSEEIVVDLTYAAQGSGLVYRDAKQSPVKFPDSFGNEVVVDGPLPVEDKRELIGRLDYVGPPADTFVNPWSAAWCASR